MKKIFLALAAMFGIYMISYATQRYDTVQLLGLYAVLSGLYLYYIYGVDMAHDKAAIWFGIAGRALLLFSVPNLSDDVYRFVWDGNLLAHGINPFDHLPSHYVDNQIFITGNTEKLHQLLNSKQYFTVYPPLCQMVFWVCSSSSFGSLTVNIFLLKIFLFAAECGTLYWLTQLSKHQKSELLSNIQPRAAVLYALNPLAIIEVCGNVHFEGAMICCLLAGIYYYIQCLENNFEYKTLIYSSLWFSFSICAKLLPMLFLPLLLLKSKPFWDFKTLLNARFFINIKTNLILFSKPILMCFLVLLWTICMYLPFVNATFFSNIFQSIGLYFGKFEFNASLYYMLRQAGIAFYGYNPMNSISNTLNIVVITVILYTALTQKINLIDGMLYVIMAYLCCATTVHPWYILLPFVLSLLNRSPIPLAWSLLVFVSYSHYYGGQFEENGWLIGLEYTVLIFIGYFLYQKRLKNDKKVCK